MGADGLRVLAFAKKQLPPNHFNLSHADVTDAMTLLGLQGMIDPPRVAAIKAVVACRSAGILVKMMTGGHATTAAAIAVQLGMGQPGSAAGSPLVLTGKQPEAIPDSELPAAATAAEVFMWLFTPLRFLSRLGGTSSRLGGVSCGCGSGVHFG